MRQASRAMRARRGHPMATVMASVLVLAAATFARRSHAGAAAAGNAAALPKGAPISRWADSGRDGLYLLQVVSGPTPARGAQIEGTVTSDTNCAPDAQGLSHCRNGIELGSGVRLEIVDTHAMMQQPCLVPGQRVVISGFAPHWITARRSGS